jgi:hypothetical protein
MHEPILDRDGEWTGRMARRPHAEAIPAFGWALLAAAAYVLTAFGPASAATWLLP